MIERWRCLLAHMVRFFSFYFIHFDDFSSILNDWKCLSRTFLLAKTLFEIQLSLSFEISTCFTFFLSKRNVFFSSTRIQQGLFSVYLIRCREKQRKKESTHRNGIVDDKNRYVRKVCRQVQNERKRKDANLQRIMAIYDCNKMSIEVLEMKT